VLTAAQKLVRMLEQRKVQIQEQSSETVSLAERSPVSDDFRRARQQRQTQAAEIGALETSRKSKTTSHCHPCLEMM
jgi:hypothetical protein